MSGVSVIKQMQEEMESEANLSPRELVAYAIAEIETQSPRNTDGKWLEELTVTVAPYIQSWDILRCHSWSDWPERGKYFPDTTRQDVGIDAVAVRSDGEHIAIQCKARQLDEDGHGNPITKDEMNSFLLSAADDFWKERWVVTNGDSRISPNVYATPGVRERSPKYVHLHRDLLGQQRALLSKPLQTRQSMQDECVEVSVRKLREHENVESGGIPRGEARGKIILPCGTGKTRVSLRIMEELTRPGDVSIVLCPSIALVAQIREEYLQYETRGIQVLAVCSDDTVAPRGKERVRNTNVDPMIDNGHVSARDIKGKVTTDSDEIAEWIHKAKSREDGFGVIIGTYQSGHRIAEALRMAGPACVLICDEAHRTAGIHKRPKEEDNEKLRNFTICHDRDLFPVTYRIYQTATPKGYGEHYKENRNRKWIVRDMDDATIFGVELFRRSYVDAVKNGWLSDYRILAVGVNDHYAYETANSLARKTQSKRKRLTADHYIRGLAFALAMGNAIRYDEGTRQPPVIKSCIAFMNTVDKSKNMTRDLDSGEVRAWLQGYMSEYLSDRDVSGYTIEHLDASDNVGKRNQSKVHLAKGTASSPHCILNVGIFGEGTDAPSLSAVAFLEPRKSPIDVIQAVGRVMRVSEGKDMGYIIAPVVIPPDQDAEIYLQTHGKEEGWQELGQILLALRAHDERIEESLGDLLLPYLPRNEAQARATILGISNRNNHRIGLFIHVGKDGEAQRVSEQVVAGESTPKDAGLVPVSRVPDRPERESGEELAPANVSLSDAYILQTSHMNADGSIESRRWSPERKKRKEGEMVSEIDLPKTRKKAKQMVNERKGQKLRKRGKRPPSPSPPMLPPGLYTEFLEESRKALLVNLLEGSGLRTGKVDSDINILRGCVKEAGRYLRESGLQGALDRELGMDNLPEKKRGDSCHIAALMLMHAAMLHQRITEGGWLPDITPLSEIKNAADIVDQLSTQWKWITEEHDFIPILKPCVDVISAIENAGKTSGLENALATVSATAERIATTYAEMGSDHAGPIFNEFMGNQASDGAFFTRPVAASIAARLTLDACDDVDWSSEQVWRDHKTLDPACGSGTLLTAMLTDMKRRAREKGASEEKIADLHKLGVEETIKGMDINSISLQLAASQLTASTRNVKYRKMGLHWMRYGPQPSPHQDRVAAGTLELILQNKIVDRKDMGIGDGEIVSEVIWKTEDRNMNKAVDDLKDIRIVIMNPPFTNREKMGEKFEKSIRGALRNRTDALEKILVKADPGLEGFADKNSIAPLFEALADHIQKPSGGIVTMIIPTVALSATSSLNKRKLFSERFHIHTILTCHQPRKINLSQNTAINESILVMQRHEAGSPKPSTRFICLDKLPIDESEVEELHRCLLDCDRGLISDGWGEVSCWPSDRIAEGDWTPAVWRSPELAEASCKYANHSDLSSIKEAGLSVWATGQLLRGSFERTEDGVPGSFPILDSKGAEAQKTIRSQPDKYWIPKKRDQGMDLWNQDTHPVTDRILEKAGHLLITAGQDTSTARLVAVADEQRYVGNGWMPVVGLSLQSAYAIAVFLNSTPGRLQLMRHPGRKLAFPVYSVAEADNLCIPDIKNDRITEILADCWERTKDMAVPQYRDGECEVRRLWDEAVAEAMGWDGNELHRLRGLLNNEPHVRGIGYNQYDIAEDDEEDDMEWFTDASPEI